MKAMVIEKHERSKKMEKKGKQGWIIVFVASFLALSASYAQYQLSPIAMAFMEQYGFTTAQYSSIFSAPLISNIFLCLIAGMIIDKYGIKKVVMIGVVLSAVGICGRMFVEGYSALWICMVLSGMSVMFLNSCSSKLFGSFFSPAKVGIAMGVFCATTQLTMTVAVASTAMLPSVRTAFVIASAISVVAVILWGALMKEPQVSKEQQKQQVSMGKCLKVVCKSWRLWIISVILICLMAANVGVNSFLPTALTERGVDTISAGVYSSALTFGNVFGSLLSPAIAAKIRNTKLTMLIFATIAALGTAFAWMMPVGVVMVIAFFATGFSMGSLMPLTLPLPLRLPEIGPTYAATAGGMVTTLEMLAASFLPSQVFIPLSGGNMKLFFIMNGILFAIAFLAVAILPNFEKLEQKR